MLLNNILTWHPHINDFFKPAPEKVIILYLFVINLIVSAIIAYILAYYCIKRLVNNKSGFFFLLLSISAFIPILGTITIISMIFLLIGYNKSAYAIEIQSLPPIDYTKEKIAKVAAYAAGWAAIRLESTAFSKKEREQALISINKGFGREVNIINRQLLSDNMDELRLYAFSLLENQQNFINKKISELLKDYTQKHSTAHKVLIEKQLALLYWELVYLNLTEDALRRLIIEKCLSLAQSALKVLTTDATLWTLMAKIHLASHQIPDAINAFNKAEKYKAPPSKIYPYLAELSFQKREYSQIKHYLCSDAAFRDIPKLSRVVEFWCSQ